MASREVLRFLKDMIKIHKPDILGLLETRVSGTKADDICNKLGFDDWVRVEALGFSGGIWVLWRNSTHINVLKTHLQFVLLQVRENNLMQWNLAIVYGSPSSSLRKRLWKDLRKDSLDMDGSWLAIGDFNVVLSSKEVSDQSKFSQSRCAGFSEWIFEQGLVDVGFEGPCMTWK